MGIGINDAMPDEAPTGDLALENMMNLIDRARQHEDQDNGEELSVKSLFLALRQCNKEKVEAERVWNEERLASDPLWNHHHPLGLYDVKDDIGTLLEILGADSISINVTKLQKATENIFCMTFGQFLDTHGLASLRTVFAYSYELQGLVGCRMYTFQIYKRGNASVSDLYFLDALFVSRMFELHFL